MLPLGLLTLPLGLLMPLPVLPLALLMLLPVLLMPLMMLLAKPTTLLLTSF